MFPIVGILLVYYWHIVLISAFMLRINYFLLLLCVKGKCALKLTNNSNIFTENPLTLQFCHAKWTFMPGSLV